MCGQGGGHTDEWRVGGPGKTRFQGRLFPPWRSSLIHAAFSADLPSSRSDLGERVVEAGVLPGHQRHPSGASPLRGQLRFPWRRGQIDKARLLSQLLR